MSNGIAHLELKTPGELLDEIVRLRKVVVELANASQSEATSRLRGMAKDALREPQ
jgi:tRNA uridine 5-carbamoylmethylation protein Kti12